MSHTPGPWKAHRYWASDDTHYHGVMARASDDGREVRVCSCLPISDDGQIGGESNCNARLIAAAPDLLDALREAEQALAYLTSRYPTTFNAFNDRLGIVRAAIAKAAGKESE